MTRLRGNNRPFAFVNSPKGRKEWWEVFTKEIECSSFQAKNSQSLEAALLLRKLRFKNLRWVSDTFVLESSWCSIWEPSHSCSVAIAGLHRGGKTLDEIDEGCTHLQFAIWIVLYIEIILIQSTGFFVGSKKDKKDCSVPLDIDSWDPPLSDQGRFRENVFLEGVRGFCLN